MTTIPNYPIPDEPKKPKSRKHKTKSNLDPLLHESETKEELSDEAQQKQTLSSVNSPMSKAVSSSLSENTTGITIAYVNKNRMTKVNSGATKCIYFRNAEHDQSPELCDTCRTAGFDQ